MVRPGHTTLQGPQVVRGSHSAKGGTLVPPQECLSPEQSLGPFNSHPGPQTGKGSGELG